MSINLASRPFENLRPVNRVKWLLVMLGVVVWGVAAVKYWDYMAGSSEETRARLQEVESEITDLNRALQDAENTIAQADLEQRNERMRFLNAKLGERAFPWSQLFQDLAKIQPYPVRLHRVSPQIEEDEETGLPAHAALSLDGTARARENWYRFVDRLFKHPSFESPRMLSENEDDQGGGVDFRLTVLYRLAMQERPAEAETEPTAETPPLADEPTQSAAR